VWAEKEPCTPLEVPSKFPAVGARVERLTDLVLTKLTQHVTCMRHPILSFLRTLSGSSQSIDRTRDLMRLRARAAFSFVLDRYSASSICDIALTGHVGTRSSVRRVSVSVSVCDSVSVAARLRVKHGRI